MPPLLLFRNNKACSLGKVHAHDRLAHRQCFNKCLRFGDNNQLVIFIRFFRNRQFWLDHILQGSQAGRLNILATVMSAEAALISALTLRYMRGSERRPQRKRLLQMHAPAQ